MVAALKSTFTKDWLHTLQTDKGLNICNRSFQTLLKKYGIQHFSPHNEGTKVSIVERFNRKLFVAMWRCVTKHQTWRYIDVLQDFVQPYNNTRHRNIGMATSHVSAKNHEEMWQRLHGHDDKGVPKFRVSNHVRISKFKRMFEKRYMANWTVERNFLRNGAAEGVGTRQ